MNKEAFSVHHLTVNYDKNVVLWDLHFSIPQGLLVGIIGPNGAGKSTLIKTAMGLVPPLSGTIKFFGNSLEKSRKHVAYVPQRASIDWNFPITVLDLVLMGRYGRLGLFKWPRQADKKAAEHYLDLVGMLPFVNRQINELSGGQQQRVFFARALLQEADLYLMDEPFTGIDYATEQILFSLLNEMKKKGKTTLVVHHDLNTVENAFDWAVLLNLRLIASGPLETVLTPENLQRAYGKNYSILDEAFRLQETKRNGRIE